ncbi:hypothetical protein COW36_00485 [bacterium (Candidatus Blackallbacteria) CG17_big_fil_post_rev_8_21_14_2_50_48_46]|uniref:DUF177 domain-containing protein n=1 Tax=bacterium (Candidatus Blackallbacteria) CG17_big_fil_post_rev_8_21_14_2_50_48_46 TaxID=2014261 RepID=A0A2M7GB33_9BACT|nr:MAG: hypothetical protein COW64_10690 [bacterium (Candidatus Blackallbacteria) CG18_big_fil_WC_8_21_14_2_50_49_26]PIW19350.1 MAG: hypothetical protein COW36_00485 [bacterium (Candidatus Blackallbacteria) CG17_big_fil_post_rev_8_21_14_2_50_48_46]PIW49046.1 MAG: hypothetical protein COW20_07970 [bacterium (Candidatus Blackallbacteria) CG13_big_fil_rev_8_21_14_2_50_49_14]
MTQFYQKFYITPAELSRLPQKTAVFELDFPPGHFDDPEMKVKSLKGQIRLELQTNIIRIWAEVQACLELICDRTLNPYLFEQNFNFEEAVEVVSEYSFEENLELTPEEAGEQILPEEELDIAELIRQYIILNLPAQKLSSESCYNEDLARVNQSFDFSSPDPAWESIRQAVQSWEVDSSKQ